MVVVLVAVAKYAENRGAGRHGFFRQDYRINRIGEAALRGVA
jgi:hypothetical protein